MKKIISIVLAVAMLLSALALVACSKEEETLKFGLGVYTNVSAASDATEDKNGQGKVTVNYAAVTLDAAGKIVACDIDVADYTADYTAEGKAVANASFETKREKGDNYNMKAYGGSALEWYEQADAFEGVVIGKTLDEVKALVVADSKKGTDDVINAGCTITVEDFVLAIEKACANAKDSKAVPSSTVKVTSNTEQSVSDATEDKAGKNELNITVFACAIDANGKVVAADTDCAQISFSFDDKGASKYDLTKAFQTKREKGDSYNMKAYGGSALEWYEQADVFAAACIDKNADEIVAMMLEDNYGDEALKTAGCTITVEGFVKAAAKIK